MLPDYDRPGSPVCRADPTASGCFGFLKKTKGTTMTVYSGPGFDMAVNPIGVAKVRAGKSTRGFFH